MIDQFRDNGARKIWLFAATSVMLSTMISMERGHDREPTWQAPSLSGARCCDSNLLGLPSIDWKGPVDEVRQLDAAEAPLWRIGWNSPFFSIKQTVPVMLNVFSSMKSFALYTVCRFSTSGLVARLRYPRPVKKFFEYQMLKRRGLYPAARAREKERHLHSRSEGRF